MSRARTALAGATLALGLAHAAACAQPVSNPTTNNFERPTDIAFVCLRVAVASDGRVLTNAAPTPRPLAECGTIIDAAPDGMGGFVGTRLYALVSQSDRGEVAVVGLHARLNVGPVDNDRQIPGFTFIPVGSFPGPIAVDPSARYAYVANTGEASISVIDTTRILRQTPTEGGAPAVGTIPLESAPGDVAAVTRGDRTLLFVTLPRLGSVCTADVTSPLTPGPCRPTRLASAEPMGGGIDGGIDAGGGGIDGGLSRDGGVRGAPYPTRLVLDEEGRAYVADRGVPIVHVLAVPPGGDALVEEAPLVAGVPTATLAVTPLVRAAGRRFVYAVDDRDKSVLVIDADPAARAVLPVNVVASDPRCQGEALRTNPAACPRIDPAVAIDRVPLAAPAREITIVTRGAVDQDCNSPIDPQRPRMASECTSGVVSEAPAPTSLRGVQAVIALRTGALQIVDIDDPDRVCAGRTGLSETLLPPFQPHAPRLAGQIALPSVGSAPALQVNGVSFAPSADTPRFAPLPGQPASDCATSPYCVRLATTPYGVRSEAWTFTAEGAIPGLTLETGAFERGARDEMGERVVVRAPGAQFCQRGALPGDRFVILAPSPRITEQNFDAGARPPSDPVYTEERCRNTFGTLGAPCNREFVVESATRDGLVLRVLRQVVMDMNGVTRTIVGDPSRCFVGTQELTEERLVEDLRGCYPQATRFEIRAGTTAIGGRAWTVIGQRSGYQHAVVEDPATGACVTDPSRRPTGRLVEGVPYEGPGFSVLITPGVRDGAPVATLRNTTYQFAIENGFAPLLIETGPAPTAVRYLCTNQRLYLVDQGRDTLFEYGVAPIDRARNFN